MAAFKPFDPADRPLSLLDNIYQSEPPGVTTIAGLHRLIAHTAQVRAATDLVRSRRADAAAYSDAKKDKLQAVMPAGIFTGGKSREHFGRGNGLYVLDFDDLAAHGYEPAALVALLRELPEVALAAVSVGGDGVFALVALWPELGGDAALKQAWPAMVAWCEARGLPSTKPVLDPSGKDIARKRFVSHDPAAYLAPMVNAAIHWQAEAPAAPMATAPPPPATVEAASALNAIPVPQDYDDWLRLLIAAHRAGLPEAVIDAWSSRGAKYRPGEVTERLRNIDAYTGRPITAATLFQAASECGYRHQAETGDAEPRAPWQPPKGPDPWTELGAILAEEYAAGQVVYDPAGLWWGYAGGVWSTGGPVLQDLLDRIQMGRYATVRELAHGGRVDLARLLISRAWNGMARSEKSALWTAIRQALKAPMQPPPPHLLATPDGVLDLSDRTMRPHSPEDRTRGITAGRYRPDDYDALNAIAWERLGRVLTAERYRLLWRWLGLALTGRAQSYQALGLIVGESGSGKSALARLVVAALGGRGMTLPGDWLTRPPSDTDTTRVDLIERQPLVACCDEIGTGGQKIRLGALLSISGDIPQSARRPYQPVPITGCVRAAFMLPAVSPPRLNADSGIARRICVIQTTGALAESEKDAEGEYDTDLLDAVITLAVDQAGWAYQPAYAGPGLIAADQAGVMSRMDPLAHAIAGLADEDVVGKTAGEIAKILDEAMGQTIGILNASQVGKRLTDSGRFKSEQQRVEGRPKRIYLPR